MPESVERACTNDHIMMKMRDQVAVVIEWLNKL